jgi:beta-galactosidase
MGNSNGSLADYYDAFETHDGLQGGFVWEWKDHGLRQQLDDGQLRFAYGGQFGDAPNDGNFVADGLVAPDGTPHPALRELAHLAAPVRATANDADLRRGQVRVQNRQWFSDVDGMRLRWRVTVDGVEVETGRVDLPSIAPRKAAKVDLPFTRPTIGPGQEAHLGVEFVTRKASAWAPRGHVAGWEQFALPGRARPARRQRVTGTTTIDGDVVRSGHIEAVFDREVGALATLRWRDGDVVVGGPQPSFWRAPTDNDGFRWLEWGIDDLHREVRVAELELVGPAAVFTVETCLRGNDPDDDGDTELSHRQSVTVLPSGELVVDDVIVVPDALDDLPRIGVQFELAPGFEDLQWLGLGPDETYPDRKRSATIGRWRSQVSDELVPYLVPQESGLHLDTRWAALERADVGVLFAALEPNAFAFSARHFRDDDLWRARDLTDLSPRAETFVHVDVAHRGVGTLSCGPDALPQYRITPGRYAWRWRLRAYDPRHEHVDQVARTVQSGFERR